MHGVWASFMKKSEMKNHRIQYQKLMIRAGQVIREGQYCAAIAAAVSALEHIDGMMQYERKYSEREFESVSAIDLILKYAPLLFEYRFLAETENLLKTRKGIEKNTTENTAEKLVEAHRRMWENHRLWSFLESNPHCRQDELRSVLGGDHDYWRFVAEEWEKIGLIVRTPEDRSYTLIIVTHMDRVVSAKCSACGTIADAPKAMFLETLVCPTCNSSVGFVFLPKLQPSVEG
jgi:hypothetical protein